VGKLPDRLSSSAPSNSHSSPSHPSFFESNAASQQPQYQQQRPCDVLFNQLLAADSESSVQWRRQLVGALGHVPPRLPTISFLVYFGGKSDNQLSKYCVVCESSWCRCQQLTALSISTVLITKQLVIDQLLHPALREQRRRPSVVHVLSESLRN